MQLTEDVRAYGGAVLGALEKKDGEALSILHTNQDLDIQTRLLDIKTTALTEADNQLEALQNQKELAQIRLDFYSRSSSSTPGRPRPTSCRARPFSPKPGQFPWISPRALPT